MGELAVIDVIKIIGIVITSIIAVVGWVIKLQIRFNNLENDIKLNSKLDEEHKTGLTKFISNVETHLREFKEELKSQSKAINSLEKDYAVLSERSRNESN